MGTRRSHLFVLLFVVGLVVVSAIVIASKETKLGLDLQGGLELVYEGQPTGTTSEVTGEDIEDSISIIESGSTSSASPSRKWRASAPTRSRSPAGSHRRQPRRRTGRQHRPALLLRLGAQPDRPRAGDRRPAGSPAPGRRAEKLEKRWEESGRSVTSNESKQLIFSGAYPNAYSAAQLAAEQEPVENCAECSVAKPRYYLFQKAEPHELIAGPELTKKDLYISPTGKKRPKNGIVVKSRPGRSSSPNTLAGKRPVDETADPGWYALKDKPALSGSDITNPEQITNPARTSRPSPSNSPAAAGKRSTNVPARSPSAARRRRSGRSAKKKRKRSPATSRSSSTTKSRPGRSSTSPQTPTGSTAAPAPRSPAASAASTTRRNWRRPCRSAPCRST